MRTSYIIEVQWDSPYPFDGEKPNCQTVVRSSFTPNSLPEYDLIAQKVKTLLTITSPIIIKISSVREIRGKSFVIDYEYIPEQLKNSSKCNENSFTTAIKSKLSNLCQELITKSIKYDLKIEDIGINQQAEPKVFLGLNFSLEKEVTKLASHYENSLEKVMEAIMGSRQNFRSNSDHTMSEYSIKVDRKLVEMEDRLNRVNRKKSHRSSQGRSSRHSKIKKNSQDHISTKDINQSNSFLTQPSSNSFILGVDRKNEKIHKSSFGDYSTTSHKLNQSSSSSLTKRISEALEKSQTAFNNYEKFSRRKSRPI